MVNFDQRLPTGETFRSQNPKTGGFKVVQGVSNWSENRGYVGTKNNSQGIYLPLAVVCMPGTMHILRVQVPYRP
jgi:hypothetical protein